MFGPDGVERYLSRVKPWQVVAIWVPVIAWLLVRASLALPAAGVAAGAAAGLASWTLLEYLLHRWVFHFEPDPGSELQRDVAWLIHGVHHDYPHDPDRLVMPPVVSVALGAALALPARAALGPAWFPPVFAGLLAGYLWYDLTHYAIHHHRPRTALGRLQRRNHLLHHFGSPGRLYGVTTPLWDLVFATHARAPRPRGATPSSGPR